MKKMILSAALALCSAFSLFAGDTENVINTVLQLPQCIMTADKDFACCTQDCKFGDYSVQMLRDMAVMLDGAHAREFAVFAFKQQNNGQELSAEIKAQAEQVAQTQAFLDQYKKACEEYPKKMKETGGSMLKVIRFQKIEIDGNEASVTIVTPDSTGEKVEYSILKLKKTGGVWKIYDSEDGKKQAGSANDQNDPKSVLTQALESKKKSDLRKIYGNNDVDDDMLDNLLETAKEFGIYDDSGKICVKNVKILEDRYAGIAILGDGKKAKKKGKPYLIFFMKKTGEKWILADYDDDKSENGKQMTDGNIKYKCNRD